MAITPKWYGLGVKAIASGAVALATDTFKLSLHAGTYSPDQDAHEFFDDATDELVTAAGYTAGGVTLASLAVVYDPASKQVRWSFASVQWEFTGVTWRYGVIRRARGGAASVDELVGYLDWGSDQTVNAVYTLGLNPAGLLYIDVH